MEFHPEPISKVAIDLRFNAQHLQSNNCLLDTRARLNLANKAILKNENA